MSTIPSLKFEPLAYNTGVAYSQLPTDGSGDLDFTRSSKATRVNNNGEIELMDNSIPRLDYTDGGCPSLLLEPASANLITEGNDISNWAFGRTTRTVTNGVNPDGTAEQVVVSASAGTNSTHRFFSNTVAITPTEDYTISVYVKKGTSSKVDIVLRTPTEAGDGFNTCVFDMNNETISNGTFEVFNDDWYRVQSTDSFNTSTTGKVFIYVYNESGDKSYIATGNENLYIWGTQIEQGSYATSYIPTNGSIATRLAETLERDNISHLINSEEGVLYFEGSALEWGSSAGHQVSLSDGSGNNRIMIFIYSETQLGLRFNAVGTQLVQQTIYTVSSLSVNSKIAVRWGNGNYSIYQNGLSIYTQAIASSPIGLSKLNFSSVTETSPFYGNIKDLRIYKTALTDEELTDLTTI